MFSKTKLNIKLAALLGILIIFLPPLWRAVVLGLGPAGSLKLVPGSSAEVNTAFLDGCPILSRMACTCTWLQTGPVGWV